MSPAIQVGIPCAFDHIPPTLVVNSPASGSTVDGTITFSANAGDNDEVEYVWFYLNGNYWTGWAWPPASVSVNYDTFNLPNGWNTFTVITQDRVGNQTRVDQSFYVNNITPTPGFVTFGDFQEQEDGVWTTDRFNVRSYAARYFDNWIWSATGTQQGQLQIPGNPDPVHWQMRVQLYGGRIEGGSDGNVVHIYMYINNNPIDAWANGIEYPNPSAPYGQSNPVNINGGEMLYFDMWATWDNWNSCYIVGIAGYYDFVRIS